MYNVETRRRHKWNIQHVVDTSYELKVENWKLKININININVETYQLHQWNKQYVIVASYELKVESWKLKIMVETRRWHQWK